MRVPKWAWLLLIVVLVTGGAIVYAALNLSSYLSANRDMITERASRRIGRPVRFDRLELSIGRGLGIAVHELAIGEDPRFGVGDFLTARSAFVQVRLLPALVGRYEVARVALESPTVSLVREKDGFNVETMSTAKRKGEAGAAATAERRTVAVALLDVDDATVRYLDRTQKPQREVTVNQLTFRASDLSFGDALRFELSAAVLGAATPNVTASGAIGPVDLANVSATPVDVIVQLDNVDGNALPSLLPAASDLRIEGPIASKLELGGTVAAWTVNFSVNCTDAHVVYGHIVDKPRDVDLIVSGHLERHSDDTVLIDAINLAAKSSALSVHGTATPSGTATRYAFSLSGAGISLADWAVILPALRGTELQGHADVAVDIAKPSGTSLPSIDGRVGLDGIRARFAAAPELATQLSGVLSFKGRSATLATSDVRIGGAPVRFDAQVDDLFAPVVAFQLVAPSLPLSALTDSETPDALAGFDATGRLSLARQAPRLDADVRASAAVITGLAMRNLRAKVSHADDITRLDPVTFDSCGGAVRASVVRSAAARGPQQPPLVDLSLHVTRVNITDLAAALGSGRSIAPAAGSLSLELAAAGSGEDWPSLQRALDGHGRFDVADGAILGINIPAAALQRVTGVPGLSNLLSPQLRRDFPGLFGDKDTRFDSLAASFRIASGRLETRDLAVKAQDFAIDAAGTIGLDLGIDLAATLTTSADLSSRLIGQVAASRHLANREGRLEIPFRLAGTLPSAKPQPDLSALAVALQRGLVDTLGERLLGGGKKKRPASEPAPAP